MHNDTDNYNHDKTCGECSDEDCPSRLDKPDTRADLRCFTEATESPPPSGQAEFAGSVTKTMDEFEEWANKNLFGVYRPIVRTKNGRGYTNERLNDCWDTWKAARR